MIRVMFNSDDYYYSYRRGKVRMMMMIVAVWMDGRCVSLSADQSHLLTIVSDITIKFICLKTL